MKDQNTDEEPIYAYHTDHDDMHGTLGTQHYSNQFMKNTRDKMCFQMLVILDDFADDPACAREYEMRRTLKIRGRHNYISTIIATQAFNALHTIIKEHASALFVYMLNNTNEHATFISDVSTVADNNTWMELYVTATSEPHNCLYDKSHRKG